MLNLPFKHPLEQISAAEIDVARECVLQARQTAIIFRNIYNIEPPKSQLIKFLEEEHAGTLSAKTQPPDRLACVQYDVISQDRNLYYMESTVHLASGKELSNRKLGNKQRHSFTVDEFQEFIDACILSPEFQQAVKKLELPKGFEEIAIDPWPFGGPDATDQDSRLTQLFCFARDKTKQNEDANHYAYPLPICVVMDTNKKTVVRVERLPTGGILDGLLPGKESLAKPTEHCNAAEYAPELLDAPVRQDYKPLNVIQPEGASFSERNGLVEWQKWRFRISFTPRECAVLHDIHYDGRSVFHRLSFSELTVPYADPRAPYHRKHAFDFGDAGAGRTANNLALGCDCLGAVRYIDAMLVSPEGKPDVSKNVVCIHEQDDGILWKHTNLITGRAVVVRNRKLIIQYIITLGNYEYIFAYHFDLAGGISVETRPTGIMSPVSIEENKFSNYGNVVGKGILAQNHQHIFAVRIDPAIDGHNNTVVTQDSIPIPMNPDTNPHGNAYEVRTTTVETSTHIDASPFTNRVIKISNPSVKNTTSGNPVAYKFTPSPSQLLLADPSSLAASRAKFATHHVWVTKHKDYEFWAGGEFTNQAEVERGGCFDAAARKDDIQNTDLVVWAVFGFTHNPRVEDWPVMPVEKHELHFTPADFFDANPALDVPSQRNSSSVLVGGEVSLNGCSHDNDSFFST